MWCNEQRDSGEMMDIDAGTLGGVMYLAGFSFGAFVFYLGVRHGEKQK